MTGRSLAALAVLAVLEAHAAENPAARYRVLSAPDCAGASNIIPELTPAPPNQTHMRVQNMGDPGTDELRGEVQSEVTWDVGTVTGLHVPSPAQRGYRDIPDTNAFQLQCDAAGFYIEHFRQSAVARIKHGEGGWVLEHNKGLNRGMEALGARINKKYRVYAREL